MAYPKCPHCKYEFDADDIWHAGRTEFPTENDGDTTETLCLSCKKPLTIILSLSPEWGFLDGDGEDIGD